MTASPEEVARKIGAKDVRLMPCEACGSEGRILRSASGRANDPYDRDCGPCPECNGTGMALVEVEPIVPEECPHCHRMFINGDTCPWAIRCPMGGDW